MNFGSSRKSFITWCERVCSLRSLGAAGGGLRELWRERLLGASGPKFNHWCASPPMRALVDAVHWNGLPPLALRL